MRLRLPFSRAPVPAPAPDYIDIAQADNRRELEKSCGRVLPFTAAGQNVSGEVMRELYLRSLDLQTRYPLGLLPIGQKRMAKWLLKQGRAQHVVSDEEVLAFLLETAADLPRGLAETYLLSPEWQRRFPAMTARIEQSRLLEFLRGKYPDWLALRDCRLLPINPPAAARPAQLGANLLAHFCFPSGLQQGALATKSALENVGVVVSCRDVPVGTKTHLLARREWLGLEVFPISIFSMSPVPYMEAVYARAGLYRRPGIYRIAYWLWELDAIPVEWPDFAGLIDEIWAPSHFIAETMRKRFTVPVLDMPLALSMPKPETLLRGEFGIPEDHFLFLFMFDLCSELERKNPLGLIRAFRRAFSPDEKVTLLLKLLRAELDPDASARLKVAAEKANVVIVNELASRERTLGFVEMCDCYVSLHRSEGFGFTMAEAMALAKPVIATGYSGNIDFMNAENSFLVKSALVPVESQGQNYRYGGRWAEPSEEDAATLMQAVWREPEMAAKKGRRAKVDVVKQLALEAVGSRMRKRLEEISLLLGSSSAAGISEKVRPVGIEPTIP